MSAPSLVVRIAASTAELRKNLAEGLNQIEATTAGMQKLSTSLQGDRLVQQAHNIVAAVNEVGGVTKLTDTETARLNKTLEAAVEKYSALGKEAPTALKELAEATRRAEEPTNGLRVRIDALTVAVGTLAAQAVTRVASALWDWGKSAATTAAEVQSLQGVSRFMGAQAGYTRAEIDALSGALQRQGITSRQSYDTITQLVRANLGLADATKLATVAQSLARATGQNSSDVLGRLIQGTQTLQVEVLRNAGVVIQLDQEYKRFAATSDRTVASLTAQEKQQIALAAVLREGERVAGVYGVTNEFVGGKIQSLKRHHEEAANSVGKLFLPVVRLAVDGLTSLFQAVQRFPGEFAVAGTAIVGISALLAGLKGAMVLGVVQVGAMTTAIALLAKVVPVAAAAFAGWSFGRWLGEATGATETIEFLSLRFQGLSVDAAEAAIATRKQMEATEDYRKSAKGQAETLAQLEEKSRAATAAAAAAAQQELAAAEAARVAADAAKRLAKEIEEKNRRFRESVKDVSVWAHTLRYSRSSVFFAVQDTGHEIRNLSQGLNANGTLIADQLTVWSKLPPPIADAGDKIARFRQQLADGSWLKAFSDTLARVPQLVQNAFTGGGGLAGAGKGLVSMFGSAGLGKLFSLDEIDKDGSISKTGGAIGNLLAKALPASFAAAIPGVGAALGSLIGPLASKIGGLFTDKNKQQVQAYNGEIEKVRQSLLAQHGTLGQLEAAASQVGLSFQAAWGHQGPEGLRQMNALVAEFQSRKQDLQKAIEKYGFTWEELGPKARGAHLAELGEELTRHFTALIGAGVDVNLVIERMGGNINEFIADALRTGTEIPAGMRPMLQTMLEMGALTDENGNKLETLEGLTWSETMTEGFSRVVDRLDLLLQGLGLIPSVLESGVNAAGNLVGAIHQIPSYVEFEVHGRRTGDDIPGGFASGTLGVTGSWFRDFGAGTPTTLHGREAVVREDQAGAFAAAHGGGATDGATVSELREIRRMLRDQPRATALAIQNALVLGGRA